MTHIQVILGSTRQGRSGEKVARWFMGHAEQRPELTVELVDLADWPLPFISTPVPPAMSESEDPQTAAWAAKVAAADGYVIVTPEYNHGYPAVLKNALDHVFAEWGDKPVGFVGYGGPAGGVRAVEQLRQVVVELRMVPLRHQVTIPKVYAAFDADGEPREDRSGEADALLDELAWWTGVLRQARVPAAA